MVLAAYPEQARLHKLGLSLDVKTRWNSTFEMLSRSLELKEAINLLIKSDSSLSKFELSPCEWERVDLIVSLLRPLQEATDHLCTSKYPSLTDVLPIYYGLKIQITTPV